MRKFFKVLGVILAVLIFLFLFVKWGIDYEKAETRPIDMETEIELPSVFVDKAFIPSPIDINEPQHPFLAPLDQSMMHAGGWQSDIHPAAGRELLCRGQA